MSATETWNSHMTYIRTDTRMKIYRSRVSIRVHRIRPRIGNS